jgi:hypothetical protein
MNEVKFGLLFIGFMVMSIAIRLRVPWQDVLGATVLAFVIGWLA